MIIDHFKIAFRHLLRHKLHTYLNITGLVVAFTVSLLVLLFVKYEYSYDQHHKNADQIFRLVKKHSSENTDEGDTNVWNATSSLLRPLILENCPEVLNVLSILPIEEVEVVFENQHFVEKRMYMVQPGFFDVFSHKFIVGNAETALIRPWSLVLTESMAKKYFDDHRTHPIGKVMKMGDLDFTVTGVIEDIPKNSHFPINFLASYATIFEPTYEYAQTYAKASWYHNVFSTYIMVESGVKVESLSKKITDLVVEAQKTPQNDTYLLQNIKDIHLHSHTMLEFDTSGNKLYIYVFSAVSILLLLIAGFNYMNLTSSQLLFFTKEMSVRKISGAGNWHIASMMFSEALMISLGAFIVSIILLYILLPSFGYLVDRELTMTLLLSDEALLIALSTVVLFTVLISFYPAILMLRQLPVRSVKNSGLGSWGIYGIRGSLITIQFTITIVMIAGTMILFKQFRYIQDRELGYKKDNIINIEVPDDIKKQYEVLKNELIGDPRITDVTFSQASLNKVNWKGWADWEEKKPDQTITMHHLVVDKNFLDFFEIQLIDGKAYEDQMEAGENSTFIILNKSAVEALGWENAIGKKIGIQWWSDSEVIGVVDDFHFQSLHFKIQPMAISLGKSEDAANFISVKVQPNDLAGTLSKIESKYNSLFPGYEFHYSFLDEQLKSAYQVEQKLGTIFSALAVISVFVALLGLFGLVSFITKRRTKEIGIRKVNGAKITEVLTLLNKDLIRWIAIAFVIATPIAWYVMNHWLQNFSYKTELSWYLFLSAGSLTVAVALITVSWQTWQAAIKSPVDALRDE